MTWAKSLWRLILCLPLNTVFSLRSLSFLQSILVNEILMYVERSEGSMLVHGVGLCVALFITEFGKAFFASLLWAVNLRSAIRMKVAFSMLAFQKIITLRTLSDISVGEVIFFFCFVINSLKVAEVMFRFCTQSSEMSNNICGNMT